MVTESEWANWPKELEEEEEAEVEAEAEAEEEEAEEGESMCWEERVRLGECKSDCERE